jgi:hypothetical protein
MFKVWLKELLIFVEVFAFLRGILPIEMGMVSSARMKNHIGWQG